MKKNDYVIFALREDGKWDRIDPTPRYFKQRMGAYVMGGIQENDEIIKDFAVIEEHIYKSNLGVEYRCAFVGKCVEHLNLKPASLLEG